MDEYCARPSFFRSLLGVLGPNYRYYGATATDLSIQQAKTKPEFAVHRHGDDNTLIWRMLLLKKTAS